MSNVDPSPPMSKRERTRAALIQAALDVVAAKGFAAASLDEIAARAGMTKGAIYSNFGSKGDLMLAAMVAKGFGLNHTPPPGQTVPNQIRALAKALAELVQRMRGEARFVAEFQLYALGDADLRSELGAFYARNFDAAAAAVGHAPGPGLAMPPRHLAVALQCIALGFIMQAFASPDDVDEAVIAETLNAFASGLSLPTT